MIQYRSFLNTDPPLIVDIWRQQPPIRGQVSSISRLTLDHHIFAKPYFDANGFLMALKESDGHTTPLGFVHAGFTVNQDYSDLDQKTGIICQLKVVPGDHAQEVAKELLDQALNYLKSKGAEQVHVGTEFPNAPFYLGLYGGSQIPGVLEQDEIAVETLKQAGFELHDKIVILERKLDGFRAIVDREQRMLKRQFQINAIADPIEKNWWESCTLGMAERDQFSVYHKTEQKVCGSVSYWDMQPLANNWGMLARGLFGLNVSEENRRCGIATFLVGESLKHLMQQGIGLVEAQTRESDAAAVGVFKKLEFEDVARGLLMSKKI